MLSMIIGVAVYVNKSKILVHTLESIENFGPGAVLVYTGACFAGTIFFFPSFILNAGGGILFGMFPGVLYCLLGTSTGSVIALLLGRYLFRKAIEKKFKNNTSFHVMEGILKKEGWKVLILARLTPVFPFLAGNYAFGLTSVSAWHYFIAAFIGSIPSASVYVYLGTILGDFASADSGVRQRTPLEWGLMIIGLLVTIILVVYLRQLAQKILDEKKANLSS